MVEIAKVATVNQCGQNPGSIMIHHHNFYCYTVQVDSAWARGDVDAAQRSSRFAKNWNVAAFVFGIVLVGIIVVAVVVSRVT